MELNKVLLKTVTKRVKVAFVGSCEDDYREKGENNSVPMIRTSDLCDYISTFDGVKYISRDFHEKNKKSQLHKGDILIARHGDNGKACIYNSEKEANCLNVVIIEPDNTKLLNTYLKYAFDSSEIKSQIRGNLVGSVQFVVNTQSIENLLIHIPTLKEQKNIVAVLSSLDDKIILNKHIITKLEQMEKRLYDHWFVQFDFPNADGKPYKASGGKMVYNEILKREIPEGWEVVPMKTVIKQINTGLNPRDNFILGNGEIKYITVKNLTEEGNIDYSNCDLINSEAQKIVHERSQIQKGDILFASICPLGRCYLIQDDPTDWDINESVFSIRPNTEKVSSEFLYTILRDSYYVKKMTQKATGSIFKGIRINDIEKIEILLPPKGLIATYNEKINAIMKKQHLIEKENLRLTALRDKLLPLLMNGQVEIIK